MVCGVCVVACQYAGNAARHSLTLGLARSIREPRLRGGYATSPARGGGRLAASSPADACAPFGFGFAESSLRFAPAHFRLRRIPAGRRVRMRRGLPSPGSVGIPPVAGSAASRLPPAASPAVTASASCRRPSSPLRSFVAREEMCVAFAYANPLLRPISIAIQDESSNRMARRFYAQSRVGALTLLRLRRAERAPQKRTCADSAQGKRRAFHGARANPTPRGARRRRDGCDWRREASRPSQARRSGGWIAPRG